jgi:hypothetical protein
LLKAVWYEETTGTIVDASVLLSKTVKDEEVVGEA